MLIGGVFNARGTVAGLSAPLVPYATTIAYDRRGRGQSGSSLDYARDRSKPARSTEKPTWPTIRSVRGSYAAAWWRLFPVSMPSAMCTLLHLQLTPLIRAGTVSTPPPSTLRSGLVGTVQRS